MENKGGERERERAGEGRVIKGVKEGVRGAERKGEKEEVHRGGALIPNVG